VVRNLIPLARSEAESPMESEARLAMLDYGLPEPVLQFEIVDRSGRTWRRDIDWTVVFIVDDVVRRRSCDMALRIDHMLTKAAA
jgi:hypothetical protein